MAGHVLRDQWAKAICANWLRDEVFGWLIHQRGRQICEQRIEVCSIGLRADEHCPAAALQNTDHRHEVVRRHAAKSTAGDGCGDGIGPRAINLHLANYIAFTDVCLLVD